MNIRIKKLTENAVIPSYAKPGDAGMDITATSMEYDEKTDCYIYHTGLAFEIPEDYVLLLFPRSSNRKTDAYLTNSVGVLDSGYRGELLVCFKSRTGIKVLQAISKFIDDPEYCAPYKVGDRIAQIIIMPRPYIHFQEVDELSETERGEGGFGSTGN